MLRTNEIMTEQAGIVLGPSEHVSPDRWRLDTRAARAGLLPQVDSQASHSQAGLQKNARCESPSFRGKSDEKMVVADAQVRLPRFCDGKLQRHFQPGRSTHVAPAGARQPQRRPVLAKASFDKIPERPK